MVHATDYGGIQYAMNLMQSGFHLLHSGSQRGCEKSINILTCSGVKCFIYFLTVHWSLFLGFREMPAFICVP